MFAVHSEQPHAMGPHPELNQHNSNPNQNDSPWMCRTF